MTSYYWPFPSLIMLEVQVTADILALLNSLSSLASFIPWYKMWYPVKALCLHIVIMGYWCQTGKMPLGKCLISYSLLRNAWDKKKMITHTWKENTDEKVRHDLVCPEHCQRHGKQEYEQVFWGIRYKLLQLLLWMQLPVTGTFRCGLMSFSPDVACGSENLAKYLPRQHNSISASCHFNMKWGFLLSSRHLIMCQEKKQAFIWNLQKLYKGATVWLK